QLLTIHTSHVPQRSHRHEGRRRHLTTRRGENTNPSPSAGLFMGNSKRQHVIGSPTSAPVLTHPARSTRFGPPAAPPTSAPAEPRSHQAGSGPSPDSEEAPSPAGPPRSSHYPWPVAESGVCYKRDAPSPPARGDSRP